MKVAYPVVATGFEVVIGSLEVDIPEAKCWQHFTETGTLIELK